MKKYLLLFIVLTCLFVEVVTAQNVKIYVSRHGGKLNTKTGVFAYNSSRYDYHPICDTLICSGSGYEICRIPSGAFKWNAGTSIAYPLFNKAIEEAPKLIREAQKESGEFILAYDNKRISIKYFKADKSGEADLLIEML